MSSGFVLDCFPRHETGRPGFWRSPMRHPLIMPKGVLKRELRGILFALLSGVALLYPASRCEAQTVPSFTITTIVGNGLAGFIGDGGGALTAELNQPHDVALDFSGNIYIADVSNARVRKVSSGIISTLAGNGTVAYAGDGGPATSAELDLPEGVAADSGGNVYIADSGGSSLTTGSPLTGGVVRKVTAGGTISSVAGYGTAGYYGDGGPAIDALISVPTGVLADSSGNLYIVDTGNNRIRKVDSSGNITTVVGNNVQGYSGDGVSAIATSLNQPRAMALDAAGNMYIADTFNQRIRMVSTSGIITTIAGTGTVGFSGDGGPATAAQLSYPSGNPRWMRPKRLHSARYINNRIACFWRQRGTTTTVAGNGVSAYRLSGVAATSPPSDLRAESEWTLTGTYT